MSTGRTGRCGPKRRHEIYLTKSWFGISICLVIGLGVASSAQAAGTLAVEAEIFAEEYAGELAVRAEQRLKRWKFDIGAKLGVAVYEESQDDIESDYSVFYPEIAARVERGFEHGINAGAEFSFGYTPTATETWKVSGVKYQTNDLNFYRLNFKADIGKSLYFGPLPGWEIAPFIRYGYRFINFERTNFNILNIFTSRDVVNEKYYIQHMGLGIRLNKALDAANDIAGVFSYARIIDVYAENSSLGRVNGHGGYLVDGSIDWQYRLDDTWKLVLGGFFELQEINGGTKDNVIWPDNNLNIYGAKAGLRADF